MKSRDLQSILEEEINEIVGKSLELKVSDAYRRWTANKGVISAWDNNPYNDFINNQFAIVNSLISAFDEHGGVSDTAKDALKAYQESRIKNRNN